MFSIKVQQNIYYLDNDDLKDSLSCLLVHFGPSSYYIPQGACV